MEIIEEIQDVGEQSEPGAATTADAGQANPAASLPILPSTNVLDSLKLTQTCLDHGESIMRAWGTILLFTGTFCTATSRTTPKYKYTIENCLMP